MKNIISFCAVLAALFIVSCSPKESGETVFNIESYELSFDAVPTGSQSIKVTAVNVSWDVKVPVAASEWLEAVKDNSGSITVSVKNNNRSEERIGRIEVIPSSKSLASKIITVTQKANSNPFEIVLEPSRLSFAGANADSQDVVVSCALEGVTWTVSVEGKSEWIDVKPGDGKVTVSVTDNDEKRYRSDRVVITPDDSSVASKSFVVEQRPQKELSVNKTEWSFEGTGWEIVGYIMITAVDVDWTMELTDEQGGKVNWITTDLFGGMITVKLSPNEDESPRVAYLKLVPDTDEVDEVVITITQRGKGQ